MALKKKDKAFRLPKISYLDFKQLEMDRVLTALFARLQHGGYPSRVTRQRVLGLADFTAEFVEHEGWFEGFGDHPDVTERWIETHLMDVVNRGKPNQNIAAPRPLHGYTYRFRNARYSRDYGAAQQLYETLHAARVGGRAIEALKRFFFAGVDPATERYDDGAVVDVETQALLRLSAQVSDAADTRSRESYGPLIPEAADLLAEDVIRLLTYERFIPRSVMVEYVKVLFAFHLGLYHLRLIRLLPALLRSRAFVGVDVGLFVDVGGDAGEHARALAERSADAYYRRIPTFVHAYFALRKLDEFADNLRQRSRLASPRNGKYYTIEEVLALREGKYRDDRHRFFGGRLDNLMETTKTEEGADPEVDRIVKLGLPEFEAYVECITALRGRFHRRYFIDALDSMLLKNRPGALLAQPRAKGAARRFVLDSRLLEVLLQVLVLEPGGGLGFHTREIRLDELLARLRDRYGICIDRLPASAGSESPSVTDREALRRNAAAFTQRLREIGFYRDLSDAYVTQTVAPRYTISKEQPA